MVGPGKWPKCSALPSTSRNDGTLPTSRNTQCRDSIPTPRFKSGLVIGSFGIILFVAGGMESQAFVVSVGPDTEMTTARLNQ